MRQRLITFLAILGLLLVPVVVAVHAPIAQSAHDFFVPGLPKGAELSTVMLLICGIVGTTP
jgi:Mn2+/Fe2+ NRAMP family transporter